MYKHASDSKFRLRRVEAQQMHHSPLNTEMEYQIKAAIYIDNKTHRENTQPKHR